MHVLGRRCTSAGARRLTTGFSPQAAVSGRERQIVEARVGRGVAALAIDPVEAGVEEGPSPGTSK